MRKSMINSTLKNPALRKRARQFGLLVRHSAVTPRTGESYKPKLASNGELGITFIGHASFLLQMGGQNVMVDPNFARWLFVLKRLRQPGVNLRDLPPIDLVLVTHAHFDHLHRPSLRAIVQQTRRHKGSAPAIVVPHHVFDLVSDLGFSDVVELDWWNSYRHRALTVTHVPSRHWGARIIKDSHRGYGGYVIRDHKHSVYHAGDTAYFSGFREIGERLSPDVALLPIGLITLRHSATCTPTPPTPFEPSSISTHAGWYPCITVHSGSPTNPWKNPCNCLTGKPKPPVSKTAWRFYKRASRVFFNSLFTTFPAACARLLVFKEVP
jgi:L-ascorbate metabolism protein UlaG (beta-lactamase superfamily)